MTSLLEFRKKYPHAPHALAYLRGDRDHVMSPVEIISFPWESDLSSNLGEIVVKIRTVPGDAGTLAETEVRNLILVPGKVRCIKHKEAWKPTPDVRVAYVEDREAKTLMICCPYCARGYSFITEQMHKENPREGKPGSWYCDRLLEILEPCQFPKHWSNL